MNFLTGASKVKWEMGQLLTVWIKPGLYDFGNEVNKTLLNHIFLKYSTVLCDKGEQFNHFINSQKASVGIKGFHSYLICDLYF